MSLKNNVQFQIKQKRENLTEENPTTLPHPAKLDENRQTRNIQRQGASFFRPSNPDDHQRQSPTGEEASTELLHKIVDEYMGKIPFSELKDYIEGAAYIRYSTAMQDDSFSLEAQLRQIVVRAKSEGIMIVKVYADAAMSAYTKRYRPGIEQMLEDAEKGLFKILYVHKVDRLARRLEWSVEIYNKLKAVNVDFRAVEQNFDPKTSEGKFMFHMLSSLSEFYSDNLSRETHKGKHERAMQGYHNGWVPFGYQSEKVDEHKMAVPIPELAPIVREMFERYASGLYYDQEIATWLNEQGCRTRKGHRFTKDTVRQILQNPFYKGDVLYHGQYFHQGRPHRKRTGEVVKGIHVPLVDEELFNRCQKVRGEKRRVANTKQTTLRVYMLSGLITCQECGRRLRAQSAKYGRYYREASRLLGVKCSQHGKSVRADLVEEPIAELMDSLVLPEHWQLKLQEMLEEGPKKVDVQKEKKRLQEKLKHVRENNEEGLYDHEPHVYRQKVESLKKQLKDLEQIAPLEYQKAGQVLENLQQAWRGATEEERQELCKIVLNKVVYDFKTKQIVSVEPKPEYEVLFRMMERGKEG